MNRVTKLTRLLAAGACLLAVCLSPGPARSAGLHDAPTVESAYPGLSAGPLSLARLGELPGGTVLRVAGEEIEITAQKLDQGIAEIAPSIQDELKRNRFYVLEQTAADAILRKLALKDRQAAETEAPSADAQEMVRAFLEQVAGAPEVTAEEVVTFYQGSPQETEYNPR